jgi:MFS family permease
VTPLGRDPGIRTFLLIWTGQLVSLIGSGLTAFSLGVWIYQRTASTTQYALVAFCSAVPPLVILPLAGPLIDRWNRKRLLVACDLAGAAATAAVGLLAWTGTLTLPAACAIVVVTSAATAMQWPAYSATVTLLVPRAQLGRASGLTQVAQAATQVLSPLLAGFLITLLGLSGVTAIDFATFLFSTATLLAAAIPSPRAGEGPRRSYWADVGYGWNYIFGRTGLLALLLMFLAVNFFSELAAVLFTPLVLNFAAPAALGSILAGGGVGMIAGGALMSAWGGPSRPALGAVVFAALGGAAVAFAGFTVSIPLLGVAVFAFFFFQPLLAGSSQVIWQRTVPAELQGRVFSVRATIALSAVPLASLAAGPLADRICGPAMAPGGPLFALLVPWLGAGPARGIALILVASGILTIAAAMVAGFSAPLRRLDQEAAAAPVPAAAAAGG